MPRASDAREGCPTGATRSTSAPVPRVLRGGILRGRGCGGPKGGGEEVELDQACRDDGVAAVQNTLDDECVGR
eukprot:5334655-Prymnesium_polylepis.1